MRTCLVSHHKEAYRRRRPCHSFRNPPAGGAASSFAMSPPNSRLGVPVRRRIIPIWCRILSSISMGLVECRNHVASRPCGVALLDPAWATTSILHRHIDFGGPGNDGICQGTMRNAVKGVLGGERSWTRVSLRRLLRGLSCEPGESGFGAQSMASSVCDGTSRRGGMRSAGSSSARTSSNSIRSRSRWQAGEPSGSTSRVFLPCMVRGGLEPSFALSFIKRFSWGLYTVSLPL